MQYDILLDGSALKGKQGERKVLDPDKFRQELELQGITLAELHARSGMNYSHLSNMKNGNIQHVKYETLIRIARHLNNIPPYKLIRDSILNLARQEIHDSLEAMPQEQWPSYLQETFEDSTGSVIYINRFPIVGHIRENGEHDLPESLGRSSSLKGSYNTIPFDGINDPDGYAVILKDQALSPDIKLGSVLLLAPKYEVENNSLCLVKTEADNRIWVRYLVNRGDHLILMTKGEITEPVIVGSKDVRFVHRCVGRLLIERPLRVK